METKKETYQRIVDHYRPNVNIYIDDTFDRVGSPDVLLVLNVDNIECLIEIIGPEEDVELDTLKLKLSWIDKLDSQMRYILLSSESDIKTFVDAVVCCKTRMATKLLISGAEEGSESSIFAAICEIENRPGRITRENRILKHIKK